MPTSAVYLYLGGGPYPHDVNDRIARGVNLIPGIVLTLRRSLLIC